MVIVKRQSGFSCFRVFFCTRFVYFVLQCLVLNIYRALHLLPCGLEVSRSCVLYCHIKVCDCSILPALLHLTSPPAAHSPDTGTVHCSGYQTSTAADQILRLHAGVIQFLYIMNYFGSKLFYVSSPCNLCCCGFIFL